jgi:hypothetical protein
MPDKESRIIGVGIDIGLIREAWRRITLRRLQETVTDISNRNRHSLEEIRRLINKYRDELEKKKRESEYQDGDTA